MFDKLGITEILSVSGGSMGGMQVLQWAIEYPDFVRSAIPIATTTRLGAQAIAFDAVGRNAILDDPNFADGKYENGSGPDRGLAMARMIGHITYLSEAGMHERFGRQLQSADNYSYDFNSEFAVESYLDHQGQLFVERFDANSYLYITKAMDYFDLTKDFGSLNSAFTNVESRLLVVAFSSDWLFTPAQSEAVVNALSANNKDVSYCDVVSPYGHDAFLLEPAILGDLMSGFIDATHRPDIDRRKQPGSVNDRRNLSHRDQARRTRIDYELIESLIEPNSTVLDIGCGDGELLAGLRADKNINAKGIELEQDQVLACVAKGLPILQHDIELGLKNCDDNCFDYVILSQTMQTLKNPEIVFKELLRVGEKVIVSFPNFANWRCRLQLFFGGRAPVTKQLPFRWYNTPNTHCLSLKDFDAFCKKLGVRIEKKVPLTKKRLIPAKLAPNLFAEQVIYVTSKE